jgi:AcrR family transcriptional regulator
MIPLRELFAADSPSGSGAAERAILRVGIQLFGRRGYGATSVRQIAAEAGVTPPLIGYHFESKEGLFRACVQTCSSGLVEMLGEALDRRSDLETLIRDLARIHFDFPKQHPGVVRLLLSVAYGPEEDTPEIDFVRPWIDVVDRVRARIEAPIDSGEFEPRAGANSVQLSRQLVGLLHLHAFEVCKRERFADLARSRAEAQAELENPIDDLVDQFFLGAGRLTGSFSDLQEDSR